MPSPSLTWDLATVFGTWRNLDGSLKAGTYTVTIPVRVTDHTDDTIIPAGTFKTGTLNSITEGTPSLSVLVPCTDDPDIDQTGWQVQVSITFADNSATENYSIDVPYANRPVGGGGNGLGVDLRTVALATSLPQSNPSYKVGVAGGLARLNNSGQVVDASGNPVTGGGGATYCIAASGTYPARPASTAPVTFVGPTSPTGGGTTAGGSGAVNGLDLWFQTVS